LILSLKYCGNMSEPKIREFLENFDVQISAGSVSNILTKTADAFEQEFDDLVNAGLASTRYQQTDDTSARVAGQFWHTHILCNPFYAAYFTRPRKDRLTVLEVLQNTNNLRFQLSQETLRLLQAEFDISSQMATGDRSDWRSRVRPNVALAFTPGMVRRWKSASANSDRTGGSHCLLSASEFGAGDRDDRV